MIIVDVLFTVMLSVAMLLVARGFWRVVTSRNRDSERLDWLENHVFWTIRDYDGPGGLEEASRSWWGLDSYALIRIDSSEPPGGSTHPALLRSAIDEAEKQVEKDPLLGRP